MTGIDLIERVLGVLAAVGGLVAAAVPVGGGIAWLMNRRRRQVDTTKVEVDTNKTLAEIFQVYATARNVDAKTLVDVATVYQSIIDELRKEVAELNGRMDKMEEELQEAQKDLRLAREGLSERDGKIRDMQRHITQLEQQLNGKEDKA